MSNRITDDDIIELRAKNLPRLTIGDLFENAVDITLPDGTKRPLTEPELAEIAAYLRMFTRPFKSDDGGKTGTVQCPGCDAVLSRPGLMGLLSPGTFTWGIGHGEGGCSRCGYPARAYHFKVGPIERMEAILPVHPDELLTSEEEEKAEEAPAERNPREKGDDDGVEYGDPGEALRERREL